MLKHFLKKEYASLCSSQTAVSFLLFGDELQSQPAAIRVSNRIRHTAIDPERGSVSTRGAQSARSWRSRNSDRERLFSTKAPICVGQARATPGNTNLGEGRTRSNSLPNGEYIEWLRGKRIYGVFTSIQQIASFEGGRVRKF